MQNATPFISPPTHEIELAGLRGLGIKRGVTVITGGGYSGKSTVLNAISAGVYNHVAGDGRELCITDETAVTITAEDGRAVQGLNISPFIKWIPGGDPTRFSTTHASGSTSQGANIMEAVAHGAKLLLIDEDRSATNFMIRDCTMKALIAKEPITPFTDRVRELAANGTATILVIGGSGEYLGPADYVFLMDEYVMNEVTAQAKALNAVRDANTQGLFPVVEEAVGPACWDTLRPVITGGFSSYPTGIGKERLEVSDTGFIIMGSERIDVRCLHDIATPAQVNALAFMLRYLAKGDDANTGMDQLQALANAMRGLTSHTKKSTQAMDVVARVQELYDKIENEGLDLVDTGFFTTMERFMDLPRPFELLAAINRMRGVVFAGLG